MCAVQCAKSVLLNKIVSSDKDIVGVVFFGTVSSDTCMYVIHLEPQIWHLVPLLTYNVIITRYDT